MSYAKNVFTNVASIGPVYFILMLFVVRMIYLLLDCYVKNELHKNIFICFLTIIGIALGRNGWWLPWSADCALFSLAFYHVGYYIKKYNVLAWCKDRPYLYFAFAPVFALMVYRGGMELAIREYSTIGLLFIGVVAIFLLLYMLFEYISSKLPRAVCMLIQWVGESTGYILIVHTLFNNTIYRWVEIVLRLNVNNIFHMMATVAIQIVLGVIVYWLTKGMKYITQNVIATIHKRCYI